MILNVINCTGTYNYLMEHFVEVHKRWLDSNSYGSVKHCDFALYVAWYYGHAKQSVRKIQQWMLFAVLHFVPCCGMQGIVRRTSCQSLRKNQAYLRVIVAQNLPLRMALQFTTVTRKIGTLREERKLLRHAFQVWGRVPAFRLLDPPVFHTVLYVVSCNASLNQRPRVYIFEWRYTT